jgi:flap endonuclease-1
MGRSRGVCSQEIKIEAYFGRKVAVDASMSIYQFLIAMQRPDGTNMLTNDAGEVTSHINGLMMRTTKMLECGIKPVYVFDGKPPDLKKGTLDDRREKRQEADEALAKAKEEGDQEAVEKVRHVANATSLAVGVDDEECAC